MKLTAHYIPCSNAEKLMNEITVDAFSGSENREYFTSISSPVRNFKNPGSIYESDISSQEVIFFVNLENS